MEAKQEWNIMQNPTWMLEKVLKKQGFSSINLLWSYGWDNPRFSWCNS